MVRSRMRARLLALAVLPLLACATSHVSATGEVKYGQTPEEDYQAGLEEIGLSEWGVAQKLLEHVRTKYPFSKYAALAELRLADAKFKQERYLEAAEAYEGFVKLHPTHEEADTAAFRVVLSHFKNSPTDFFVLPSSIEKDQKELKASAESAKAFLKARPGTKHQAEAEQILEETQGRLAAHEWYVAEFYYKRAHWAGAAGRLETIVKEYPGTRREPEALLLLARCYLAQQEGFRAQQALQKFLARHPEDARRPEAEALLAGLRR